MCGERGGWSRPVAPLGGGGGRAGALFAAPPRPPSPGSGAGAAGVGYVVLRSAPARLGLHGGGGCNGRNGLPRPLGQRGGGGGRYQAGRRERRERRGARKPGLWGKLAPPGPPPRLPPPPAGGVPGRAAGPAGERGRGLLPGGWRRWSGSEGGSEREGERGAGLAVSL